MFIPKLLFVLHKQGSGKDNVKKAEAAISKFQRDYATDAELLAAAGNYHATRYKYL